MELPDIENSLNTNGYSLIPNLIDPKTCDVISSLYADEQNFRKKVIMERHRFGKGEYQYFKDPLPDIIRSLREEFYQYLRPIATNWMNALNIPLQYPETLNDFLFECAQQDQKLPTPLLLKYKTDGYNCLHRDLYGDLYFPFQMMICLSQKDEEYTGGEFLLLEQKYMSQSSCEVIAPNKGDAVIFSTQYRPVVGKRGYHKAQLKHGVSKLRSGTRFSLGIIFHNAHT